MTAVIEFPDDAPNGRRAGVPNAGARGGDLAPPGKLRRFDLEHMLSTEPPEVDFVVDGLAARGEVTVLWGPGGIGKSLLIEACARGVALGEIVAGLDCKRGRVLYFDAENGEYEVHRRVHSLQLPASRVAIYDAGSGVHLVDDFPEIAAVVEAERPHLIVFDSLRRLTGGSEENDSNDMAEAIGSMKRLAQDANAAVVVIHHSRKDGTAFRGSSAIRDQVSISWQMGRELDDLDRTRRFLRNDKMRVAAERPEHWLHIVTDDVAGTVELVSSDVPDENSRAGKTQASTSIARLILDALTEGPMTRPDLAVAIGRTPKDGTVRRTLGELQEKGHVRAISERRWEGVPNPDPRHPPVGTPSAKKGAKRGATGTKAAPSSPKKRKGPKS